MILQKIRQRIRTWLGYAVEKTLQEEYFKFRESDRKWKRNVDVILKELQSARRPETP